MRHWLGGIAAIVVTAAVGAPAQADEVTDVINKAIKAHGGKAALSKYRAATLKGSGTVNAMGMELKYTATWYFSFPGNYRVELEADADGNTIKVLQVSNGKEGWQKIADMATMELPKNEMENVKKQMAMEEISTLVPLLDKKKYTVATLGDVKVRGKKAIGLNVMSKDGVDVNLYLDPESFMIVKHQYQAKDPAGKEVTQSVYPSGFKKYNGVVMPAKVLIDHDDKKFVTAEFSEIKLSEKLDASLFKKP
jgi:outer membrane lipoprotein-sorting protein